MRRDTFAIIAIAAAGQGVSYALAILLARRLGIAGFEAYVVASAVFIVLVAIAPCGLDRYALRLLPALLVRNDWDGAHGFLRFGVRTALLAASAMALVVGASVWWWPGIVPETRLAIVLSCLALPGGALAHFGGEVLMATGRELLATAILRIMVPVAVIVLVGIAIASPLGVSGPVAIAAWGLVWVGTVGLLATMIRSAMPPPVWRAEARESPREWRDQASVFWVHRIAMATMAQASVVALELLQPSSAAVGAYAAALATASPALVLVTATNRIYARRLSILLEQNHLGALLALRRKRLVWLVPAVAVFLFVTIVFASEVMSIFGPGFVEDGATPLRLISAATAFTIIFALSPTYLKYRQRRAVLLGTMLAASACQLVLLVVLVPGLGATGAAIAFGLSIGGMYGVFAVIAWRDLKSAKEGA